MASNRAANLDYDIGIIGGGFGGLGAAIKLKEAGNNDFIIFERANQVGGTWRDNIYPGCACDIPSHLYSFSFEMNPNWSSAYSAQKEILAYIIAFKDKHQLEAQIRYNTRIVKGVFDDENACWELTDQDGNVVRVRAVISAIGPLNVPNIPPIKGLENFEGAYFHSSEWDAEADLKGKKVAVVGTGASAIQIVPAIAPEVGQLSLFQRTAPWVLPRDDRPIGGFLKKLYQSIPPLQKLRRASLYWFFEYAGKALFSDNLVRKITKRMATKHIRKGIADPELRKKVTPPYEIGCKRRLLSDDYYPALTRDNVALVTDSIQEIGPNGLLDNKGRLHEADVIIFATGFHVADFTKRDIALYGRNGRNLFDSWQEHGPEAYYGTCIAGYPNLLLILGPNTGLGHNSQLHIIESQLNFIMDYFKELDQLPPQSFLDVKAAAQQKFNDEIQQKLQKMVWSAGGCNSWYIHESGRNSTLWPGYTITYRKKTKKIKLNDFEIGQTHQK